MSAPQIQSGTPEAEPREWEPPRVFPVRRGGLRAQTHGAGKDHPEVSGMDGHAKF
jgi:hypothetical protein